MRNVHKLPRTIIQWLRSECVLFFHGLERCTQSSGVAGVFRAVQFGFVGNVAPVTRAITIVAPHHAGGIVAASGTAVIVRESIGIVLNVGTVQSRKTRCKGTVAWT